MVQGMFEGMLDLSIRASKKKCSMFVVQHHNHTSRYGAYPEEAVVWLNKYVQTAVYWL